MWDTLETTHEGTEEVKRSRLKTLSHGSNPPMAINLDDLMGLIGPISRAKAKKSQSILGQLVLSLQVSLGPSDNTRPINCILVEDEPFEGHNQE
ncbi:hypothetical protein Lal_00039437 [Lupinus albus]|nr:hypothetical protein Lal_00039437 [Lupinus albus]